MATVRLVGVITLIGTVTGLMLGYWLSDSHSYASTLFGAVAGGAATVASLPILVALI